MKSALTAVKVQENLKKVKWPQGATGDGQNTDIKMSTYCC